MEALADTARFRPEDPEALVLASLACPICLSSAAVRWRLDRDGYDPSVECACERCVQSWRVYLSPYQALRVSLLAHGAAR